MTAWSSGAADRIALKCAFCADSTVPRESTRGITIKPLAPTCCACSASATAVRVLTAPVPTITGMPAPTSRSTPSMRSASVSSGQSPIEPA